MKYQKKKLHLAIVFSALSAAAPAFATTQDTNEQAAAAMRFAEAPVHGADEQLQYRVLDGMAITEGDIALGTHKSIQRQGIYPTAVVPWTMEKDDRVSNIASIAIGSKVNFWPNGVVPYTFAHNYGSSFVSVVESAMRAIEAVSNVRFVRRSNQRNAVSISGTQAGCWSYVGMQGNVQTISIGRGCAYEGIVVHELLHALGIWHEQSRGDRDSYIDILWENVQRNQRHNFEKAAEIQFGPYDYASIMHYPATAFSANGRPTIRPKQAGVTLGNRQRLSPADIAGLKRVYGGDGGQSNGEPQITLRAAEAVIFNNKQYELIVRLADDSTPARNLKLKAESGNQAVLPQQGIVVKQGSQDDERVITFTPNRQITGTAQVSIQVTDAQGHSTTKQFKLIVKQPDEVVQSGHRSLKSQAYGQCLSVEGTVVEGAAVGLENCNGQPKQQWLLDTNSQLRLKASGDYCLDLGRMPFYNSRASIRQCEQISGNAWNYVHQQWRADDGMLISKRMSNFALTASSTMQGTVMSWAIAGMWSDQHSGDYQRWEWQDF